MTKRVALIGLSNISVGLPGEASDASLGTAVPFSHASAVAAISDLDLVAGCDIDRAARERFIERWSSTWPGLRAYADFREMLEAERPDVVTVATPDHLHVEALFAAVEAGVGGVFCEKPLATSLAEADEVVRLARDSGVKVNVNYTLRWMPEYVEAHRLARSGAIGTLSQITFLAGGPRAMLFRNHTHVIDLMRYFAGSEPNWVWAELEQGFEDYGTVYAGDGGRSPEREPGANYYIAFGNGVRAYVTGTKDCQSEYVLELVGSAGRVMVDTAGVHLVVSTPPTDKLTWSNSPTVQTIAPQWTVAGITAGMLEIVRAIDTGAPVTNPPESARVTVAITQAILLSQARGNVRVPLAELTGAPA